MSTGPSVLEVALDTEHKDREFAERYLEDTTNYYKIVASMLQRCMEEKGQPFTTESEFSNRKAIIRQTIEHLMETVELDGRPNPPPEPMKMVVENPTLIPMEQPEEADWIDDDDEFAQLYALLNEGM
jgi:hypothetical protein